MAGGLSEACPARSAERGGAWHPLRGLPVKRPEARACATACALKLCGLQNGEKTVVWGRTNIIKLEKIMIETIIKVIYLIINLIIHLFI